MNPPINNNLTVIDAHALLGSEEHLHLEADELLRRMDRHGIETAIARPMGGELVVYNTAGNERVLKAHPRIKGMVTASPWYGDKALQELERCQDLGAVGLFLHPNRQGFMPTDDIVRPILDWVAQSDWPVMFHTGSYINSDVLALGEVARKYPTINFIAGFGGFTDMWFEIPGVFAEVDNLYLDASMIWSAAIEQLISERGANRVLFGGAEPRGRYAVGLNIISRLDLTVEQQQAVLAENARRLFSL